MINFNQISNQPSNLKKSQQQLEQVKVGYSFIQGTDSFKKKNQKTSLSLVENKISQIKQPMRFLPPPNRFYKCMKFKLRFLRVEIMNIPECAGAHTPLTLLAQYSCATTTDHILIKMRLFWQQPGVLFFTFWESGKEKHLLIC